MWCTSLSGTANGMSITNRQFKWLENRVSTKCYEGGLKGKQPDAIMADILNGTKVLKYKYKAGFLFDREGNVYLFDYHDTHMFVVINEEHGFVSWHLGTVKSWPYYNERQHLMEMAVFGVDPRYDWKSVSIF